MPLSPREQEADEADIVQLSESPAENTRRYLEYILKELQISTADNAHILNLAC